LHVTSSYMLRMR